MSKKIRLTLAFLFIVSMCIGIFVPMVAMAETDVEGEVSTLPETLTWEYTAPFVYDGEEKTVILADGQVDLTKYLIEYQNNAATDASDYTAVATVKDIESGAEVLTATLEWKITPYVIDLNEIVWDYSAPFVYSGDEYTVAITELPEFLDPAWVSVSGTSATAAGKYTATVSVAVPEDVTNYTVKQATYELAWYINKADYDMSSVTFEGASFRYDGRPHSIKITGKLPKGVTVSYDVENVTASGVYPVTATFAVEDTDNYNVPAPMKADMHIRILSFTYPAGQDAYDVKIHTFDGIDPSLNFVVNSKAHNYISGIEVDGVMMDVLGAYDIGFTKNGDSYPLTGNFTLSIRIPKQHLGIDELYVVHIDDNGNVEMISPSLVTRDDRLLVLTAESFSVYAIVTPVVADEIVDDSSDDGLTLILIAVLAVLILVSVAIFIFKRKSSDEDPTDGEPTSETPGGDDSSSDATEESAPAEETPAETAPTEEIVEETTANEEKADETNAPADVQAPAADPMAADGETVLVRYRSSFQSRLIQSDDEIQGYYTALKNKLLSYKGVKARTSWNFESFNKTKIQCAKLNIKGKAILLYINLDTEQYSATKYHFQNVADQPKFSDVPMLLKIKSERGLKYALELIDELMRQLDIPAGEEQNVDYRVPFETNETLAARGLVKVILPKGVALGDNVNLVGLNVSELLDGAKGLSAGDEE